MTRNDHSLRPSPASRVWLGLTAGLLVIGGCDDGRGQIRTYSVPKEQPSPEAQAASSAMTLTGDMVWDLPEGWRALPNTNEMRFATIGAGDGDDAIEVAVTRLGGAAGGVVANVNRWRGQLGLAPATEEAIAAEAMLIQAKGPRGLVVDLVGPDLRMLAAIFPATQETWFIKTTAPTEAIEPQKHAFLHLCESVRFSGASDADAPDAGGVALPAWSALPEGWTMDPAPKAMSVASITVTGNGQEASLTVTSLGGRQDWLANVNRWRRQLGLAPIATIDAAMPVAIEVDGIPGMMVDVAGDDERTIGFIIERGTTWFFKLAGPDPLVSEQRPAFEAFLRSLTFEG